MIEKWFSELPESQRHRFLTRIQSRDDIDHEASVFELFTHAFLVRNGCQIAQYEPQIGSSRPEFLVRSPLGQDFVFEATVVARANSKESAQERHKNRIWKELGQISGATECFSLDFKGDFTETPSAKKISAAFKTWLSTREQGDTFLFEEKGVLISLEPLPEFPKDKSASAIAIVTGIGKSGAIFPQMIVLKKVKDKAKQLSECEIPTLLALKTSVLYHDTYTMSAALFGDERIHFSPENSEVTATTRADNGALFHQGNPELTSISALISFQRAEPWTLAATTAEVWHHPSPTYPLETGFFSLPEWVPDHEKGEMTFKGGHRTVAELFSRDCY